MSDELPSGWASASFMEVFDIQGGTQPPKSTFKYEPTDGYVRLLQIRDFGEKPVPTFIQKKPTLKTCQNDDVLIGRYGASIGRICTGMKGAYNVALAKVIMPEQFERRFVFHLLRSPLFQRPILDIERSAQDGFNKEDLAEIVLPVTPLNEQRRIVAKLETLLGKVDASQQRLAKIPVLLKRFRQSVLAAACSGRLTADWREENPDTESAVQLLRSFNAKPLPEGDEDVPDKWCWGRFGEIVTNHDGKRIPIKQSDRDKRSGSYPYYGAFGVIDDIDEYLYDGDYLLLAEDGKNLESRLRPISLIASGKFWVNNHAHVLQAKGGIPLSFLNAWLNSPTLDLSEFLTGIDQVKLNRAAMDRIPVPIAPLPEQKEIVRRVEGLFALADQLEERLAKARGQVDKLTPSLLARAFAGQLVPQDPTDEPADKLLERLKKP